MYQIDIATASSTQPPSTAAGNAGFFTDGNPALGVPATLVPAEFLNTLMLELVNAVKGAGLTLAKANFTQLQQAIKRYTQVAVVLADAGGAANTYATVNVPALAAGDVVTGLSQRVQIANTNTGASTFAPDGLATKPIFGLAKQPLQGGELVAGGEALLTYSQTANGGIGAWILAYCSGGSLQAAPAQQLNQLITLAQASSLGGTIGQYGLFPLNAAPAGWLKANGAAIPVSAYGILAAQLYCGDAANATALYGYRCTNQSTPTTSRSTTGAYIVLPDARGEFLRAWDDGRGIDASRSLWAWQAGQNLSHTHTASASTDGGHAHNYVSGTQGVGYQTGGAAPVRETSAISTTDVQGYHSHTITVNSSGGTENLVRNLAALVCIKY
ncbi:MAG: hypothetical protein GAK35_03549 [Herbaspirillum frisingense]|uniref:Phage tail collar domain-containing protein n=1 Tax=Herbaspirillum frisingense TaxID=92645 RepID=A0A7V8FU23_9BURK|nr:MAG: hypothetical protein GAK35_03549 [Herbaspirillum frisingense]